ncbi:MAG: carboxylesterase family protein [Prevotella sp.]|nr:carboxylesterase family protein [Prevotella sp.]
MRQYLLSLAMLFLSCGAMAQAPRVTVASGILEGRDSSGVKVFEGIPFAAPPVGELRWKAPQPVTPWQGVREAKKYGPNPIMFNAFGDMIFKSKEFSEDCLYLNVWTPAKTMREKLPVLIYFNGGGLLSGSGSEPRYEGVTLARKGIIVVTANYREGIFGFLAHPQLSKETSYHGSGNYGFMDQAAAIKWVKENISAFGGDPDRITINGESAGSMSVSGLMASPLSRNLIHQVMASSGAVVGMAKPKTLQEAEKMGEAWAKKHGFTSIKELRKVPAEELNKMAEFTGVPSYCIDGYFFTEQPEETFRKGEQAQVSALIGNNSAENTVMMFMPGMQPTLENLSKAMMRFFGADTQKVLDLYGFKSDADIMGKAGWELGGDLFIAYSTWKWTDLLRQTSKHPVYRYLYCHPRPMMNIKGKAPGLAGGTVDVKEDEKPKAVIPGAVHSADIEYAMGNLSTNHLFPWEADDYVVSDIFQGFYVNFVKTGNPNGLGLPEWTATNAGGSVPVMLIDTISGEQVLPALESRYQLLDGYLKDKSRW